MIEVSVTGEMVEQAFVGLLVLSCIGLVVQFGMLKLMRRRR